VPRIQPLTPREFPPEMRDALAALRPPNPRHDTPPTENRPKALNVLGTMAHHPALARAFFTFNGHILMSTTLTERERELIVMRVAAVRRCGYEWAQHLFMARDVGLSDEEIGRIAYGPDAPFWGELDAALLRAVDELIGDGAIGASTWHVLGGHLDTRQLLDVIFTVGAYDTLARMFSSLELDMDAEIGEFMARYDELF
jgi:AhpD family alkylhydroperoxidase